MHIGIKALIAFHDLPGKSIILISGQTGKTASGIY